MESGEGKAAAGAWRAGRRRKSHPASAANPLLGAKAGANPELSRRLQQPAVQPGLPRLPTRFVLTPATPAAGRDDADTPNLLLGPGITGSFAARGLSPCWGRAGRAGQQTAAIGLGGDAGGSEAGLGEHPDPERNRLPGRHILQHGSRWASPPSQGRTWGLRSHSSVEESPGGAGSSAGTSNRGLSCLHGVQKCLPPRSSRSPRSTPGFSSPGHAVPRGWEVVRHLELKTKPRVSHPRLLHTACSSPNARKTWTGMKGKGLLTPADL